MAGKGPADGGATGTVRNEDKYCKADGCNAYPIRGLTVCKFHGGGTELARQAAERNVATADLLALAHAAGVDVPAQVKPAQFRWIAAEYVARFNRIFGRLETQMDIARATMNEVDLAREYGDILALQRDTAHLVTKMMHAAAALGLGEEDLPDPQAQANLLMGALDDVREKRDILGEVTVVPPCPHCAAMVEQLTALECAGCVARDAEDERFTTLLAKVLEAFPDAAEAVRRALEDAA